MPDRSRHETLHRSEGPERERIVERRTSTLDYKDDPIIDHRRRTVSEHEVSHAPWSPAQGVALIIGIALAALGGLALARGGLDDLFEHITVGGLHHTQLLGLIELVFGAFLIMLGAIPGAGRSLMAFIGALALVFGIVVAIEPSSFHDALGVHAIHGALYIAIGVVLLAAAMAAPIISTTRFSRD